MAKKCYMETVETELCHPDGAVFRTKLWDCPMWVPDLVCVKFKTLFQRTRPVCKNHFLMSECGIFTVKTPSTGLFYYIPIEALFTYKLQSPYITVTGDAVTGPTKKPDTKPAKKPAKKRQRKTQ